MSTAVDTSPSHDQLPFPAVWLRDNCQCPQCRDPRNGQKLIALSDIPAGIAVRRVVRRENAVTVTFDGDDHQAEFTDGWLAAHRQDGDGDGDGRTENDKALWSASDLDGQLPTSRWQRYNTDDRERLRVLREVRRLGFAVLHGTPTEDRTVLRIAETFGYVRVTNYGELFDVQVEAHPTNLAFTGLAIAPHTDNPYRDPVPTMQLLHCLSNAVDGGESGLVDGFYAASLLRAEDPEAFRVLTSTPVSFAWSDAHASLRAERPLIDVDPRGRIREVRFNNRSMGALHLPYDELVAFYAAYRRFAEIVERPDLLLTFRLDAGDCVIFDNVRLLHARTAFADTSAGARHLQGCYADLDALTSTIEVLGGTR